MPSSSDSFNPTHDQWAAIDLGSNSFHLLIAKPAGASFVVVERLKEKVQLLGGFRAGELHPQAQERGLACLARFAQRLKSIPPERTRAMGTYALRQAANAQRFTQAAEAILGVPIRVITGQQEAGLIYQAVDHHVNDPQKQKWVIDIGGGSTEFAMGVGAQVNQRHSIDVGCVAFKDKFFAETYLHAGNYLQAKAEAKTALQQGGLVQPNGFENQCWYGTSGTIASIAAVLSANGWSNGEITTTAIQTLEEGIVNDHWVLQAGLPGLAPDRADIFAGGLAILSACFEVLGINRLQDVDVSLLQGIICEAVLPEQDIDLQEDSVVRLSRKFAVDQAQAQGVEETALLLFDAAGVWQLDESYRKLISWAARLHEVGTHISPQHYHRHGGYMIRHTAMPGFSELQKSMLALLIKGHRRRMPGLAFQSFPREISQPLIRLVALLRIAVILRRSHDPQEVLMPRLRISGGDLEILHLDCGADWLRQHPLSARELEVEKQQLATAGLHLKYR